MNPLMGVPVMALSILIGVMIVHVARLQIAARGLSQGRHCGTYEFWDEN